MNKRCLHLRPKLEITYLVPGTYQVHGTRYPVLTLVFIGTRYDTRCHYFVPGTSYVGLLQIPGRRHATGVEYRKALGHRRTEPEQEVFEQ